MNQKRVSLGHLSTVTGVKCLLLTVGPGPISLLDGFQNVVQSPSQSRSGLKGAGDRGWRLRRNEERIRSTGLRVMTNVWGNGSKLILD